VLPTVLQCADAVTNEATECLAADEARTLELLLSRLCACGMGDSDGSGSR